MKKLLLLKELTADQTMIFELVENLVSNAIKYNKDGGSILP